MSDKEDTPVITPVRRIKISDRPVRYMIIGSTRSGKTNFEAAIKSAQGK